MSDKAQMFFALLAPPEPRRGWPIRGIIARVESSRGTDRGLRMSAACPLIAAAKAIDYRCKPDRGFQTCARRRTPSTAGADIEQLDGLAVAIPWGFESPFRTNFRIN